MLVALNEGDKQWFLVVQHVACNSVCCSEKKRRKAEVTSIAEESLLVVSLLGRPQTATKTKNN